MNLNNNNQKHVGHLFEISNKSEETSIMTGANTQILMDGKPLTHCISFKFEVEAGGIATITATFLGSVKTGKNVIGQYDRTITKTKKRRK